MRCLCKLSPYTHAGGERQVVAGHGNSPGESSGGTDPRQQLSHAVPLSKLESGGSKVDKVLPVAKESKLQARESKLQQARQSVGFHTMYEGYPAPQTPKPTLPTPACHLAKQMTGGRGLKPMC